MVELLSMILLLCLSPERSSSASARLHACGADQISSWEVAQRRALLGFRLVQLPRPNIPASLPDDDDDTRKV